MRDLGSSPVAASIKKPRMRSYQTACSVLLGARHIIHFWRRVKDPTDSEGRSKETEFDSTWSKFGAEDEGGTARRRRTLKVWRRLLMSTASNGVSRGARQVSLGWYPEAKTRFQL